MRKKREKPYWTNECRHFTSGVDVIHDGKCKLGVCYRSVTTKPDDPGSMFRLPCHTPNEEHGLRVLQETGPAGTCEHFSSLTEQEIEQREVAAEASFREAIRRMQLVGPIITAMKQKYKGKSVKGIKTCPVCQGKLHLTHSGYNGHVWGKCETDGCLSWMK